MISSSIAYKNTRKFYILWGLCREDWYIKNVKACGMYVQTQELILKIMVQTNERKFIKIGLYTQ
jgi:hypothetical protein